MQKRAIALSVSLILSIFLLINFISADNYSCNIVTRSACTGSGHIIMSVSDLTNAHGELPNQGNYNDVVCCYFGDGNTTCSSKYNTEYYPLVNQSQNKIVGLSSATNAHAEGPGENNYPATDNICYYALQCISTINGCDSTYNIPVLNLSDLTNAHIGTGDGFNTAICCQVPGVPYTVVNCNLTSATWTYSSVMAGDKVGLSVTGTTCAGADVTFNVTDQNGNQVGSVGDVGFPNNGNSVMGIWTTKYYSGQPNIYSFTATVASSNSMVQSVNGGGNTTLKVNPQDPNYCQSIITSSDYTDAVNCSSDPCNIAKNVPTISQGGPKNPSAYSFGFSWNGTACNFENYYQGNGAVLCNNGYTLCTSQISNLNYCYPGSTCLSGDRPSSNGNGACDPGEGCSSIDCKTGDQDNCVIGSVCNKTDYQTGMCYATTPIVNMSSQCANGYTLCSNPSTGLIYCYPSDSCPTGDNAPTNSCANSNTTNGNNPGSCLGDGICQKTTNPNGFCSSQTASVGTCTISFAQTAGNSCDNGFLTYNWTANWSGTGARPPSCKNGQNVIECPAQIPLPLFTATNAIITILAIIVIYSVIVLVKKSKRHTIHSHNRKTSKK